MHTCHVCACEQEWGGMEGRGGARLIRHQLWCSADSLHVPHFLSVLWTHLGSKVGRPGDRLISGHYQLMEWNPFCLQNLARTQLFHGCAFGPSCDALYGRWTLLGSCRVYCDGRVFRQLTADRSGIRGINLTVTLCLTDIRHNAIPGGARDFSIL